MESKYMCGCCGKALTFFETYYTDDNSGDSFCESCFENRPKETPGCIKARKGGQRQLERDHQNIITANATMDEGEDNDFQCCDNCDLPDACSDYGCAIKQGIKEDQAI